MHLRRKQLESLGVETRTRISPLLQKCCLCLSANESFARAEADLGLLTGMKVGHSTLQRQVQTETDQLELKDSQQAVNEVCLDGGKVRLRTEAKGQSCQWKDYKAARLSGIYYGATFDCSEELIAWINSQSLTNPLIGLGDGHDGIWNLFAQIGTQQQRQEILDWFHLKENLFKVGGHGKDSEKEKLCCGKEKFKKRSPYFNKNVPSGRVNFWLT